MGIHGVYKEIGPGERVSLAKVSADHFSKTGRPFRLAIDISIWLFQIQASKGGSNPALRTFFYRLVRLLCLNIQPVFVFDGPNKPLFKRNKRVGGPGARVATVPEFLSKQLLKGFALPWHIAPGEAEAECALLQREGIVDAVLSEDVDTLMFGCGVTLRNWTSENTGKSPTHVNLYRKEQTKEKSGLDREGMILVALMSGGDYIPEGIPGCGPKVACDAARAGFGHDLCSLGSGDSVGLQAWKYRLQHELETNESKYFSRRNKTIKIPEDFPNHEVLGYYSRPCVSSTEKLEKLRKELEWNQEIDFSFLRSFTAEAFDWRCLGGAKKFIKTMAPALLIRSLWLISLQDRQCEIQDQAEAEKRLISSLHGTRQHNTTDGILEYRVSIIPATLVTIDLSIEEPDDEDVALQEDDSDPDIDGLLPPSSTQIDSEPKKRVFKPIDPMAPHKLWVAHSILQIGCPLLLEDYEASLLQPKKVTKAPKRRKADAGAVSKALVSDMQENALLPFVQVTKPNMPVLREVLKDASALHNAACNPKDRTEQTSHATGSTTNAFKLLSTRIPAEFLKKHAQDNVGYLLQSTRPNSEGSGLDGESRQPARNKKRSSSVIESPSQQQRTINSFFSPSTLAPKESQSEPEIIDLSSNPATPCRRSARRLRTSPPYEPIHTTDHDDLSDILPTTVTRRRRRSPMKRWHTEPTSGDAEDDHISEMLPIPPLFDINKLGPSKFPETTSAVAETIDIDGAPAINRKSDQSKPSIPPRVPQNPNNPHTLPNKSTSTTSKQLNPLAKPRKKLIQLRPSLSGSWKEVEADIDTLDLTLGSTAGSGKSIQSTQQRGGKLAKQVRAAPQVWRRSGVEVLDLTSP